jgi:hypothetical protein
MEAEWLIINKKERWVICKCRNCKVFLKVLIPYSEGNSVLINNACNTYVLGRIDENEKETTYPIN